MAAPIAPPPRARPPPTKAPAVLMADSMVVAATVSPWFRAGVGATGLPLVWSSWRSAHELWVGGAFVLRRGVGRGGVVGVGRVLVVVVGVTGPGRHAEVED